MFILYFENSTHGVIGREHWEQGPVLLYRRSDGLRRITRKNERVR